MSDFPFHPALNNSLGSSIIFLQPYKTILQECVGMNKDPLWLLSINDCLSPLEILAFDAR